MVKLENITKKYGSTTILNNTSYEFCDKGITCLLGASGCGKSTLFHLIAGFDTDYEGEITSCTVPITKLSSEELCEYRKAKVGFIFQNYHLLSGYTVLENVMLADGLSEKTFEENKASAMHLLEKLGIDTMSDKLVDQLSGGQKQRTCIARALMNQPELLLADEPTGALDRNTSIQIMDLLKEISKSILVIIITHDKKNCDWADDIISIKDTTIQEDKKSSPTTKNSIILNEQRLIASSMKQDSSVQPPASARQESPVQRTNCFKRAKKNIKVRFLRCLLAAFAVAVGITAFTASLSSQNIISQSIEDFKNKNTVFNNGYIKYSDDNAFLLLKDDQRVENIYYQYKLQNLVLEMDGTIVDFPEKIPMPKTSENLSYGVMPRSGKNEIAISPSVAKKFSSNISGLPGQTLQFQYGDTKWELTISGIFNAQYDDFFLSTDLEQQLYSPGSETPFSLSFDVKEFTDVPEILNFLKGNGINNAVTAAGEVSSFLNTFKKIKSLFMIVSGLILLIGIFISAILLIKLANTRCREIGLLSALGFHHNIIIRMLTLENLMISGIAVFLHLVLFFLIQTGFQVFSDQKLNILPLQLIFSAALAFVTILTASMSASRRLVKIEPAEALRN